MLPDRFTMFRNRLRKVYRHISRQAIRQGISCFRVYDHDLPEFPFCIEIYENHVYLAEYKRRHGMDDEAHEQWLEDCLLIIHEVTGLSLENMFIRQRQRKAGRTGQYQRVSTEERFFIVKEDRLKFKVNLSDYLDTGLFLDHRITRSMVKEKASKKNVLNLFCYTGSFSVYAAAGGANEVVSVDLSNTYLKWAEDNFRLNQLINKKKYQFVKADVKQWLDKLPPDHFDLVVMDPPTFSNSKMMKDFLDIQKDHAALLNKVLKAVRLGGSIYFSTNFSKFSLDKEKINASGIKDIARATTPFDFKGKLSRYCYLITK